MYVTITEPTYVASVTSIVISFPFLTILKTFEGLVVLLAYVLPSSEFCLSLLLQLVMLTYA